MHLNPSCCRPSDVGLMAVLSNNLVAINKVACAPQNIFFTKKLLGILWVYKLMSVVPNYCEIIYIHGHLILRVSLVGQSTNECKILTIFIHFSDIKNI